MPHHRQKGTSVTHSKHSTPPLRAARVALLRALLHAWRPAAAFAAVVAGALLLAAPAFAARTYSGHQITSFAIPTNGSYGPSAVTVDPADDLWFKEDAGNGAIVEYGPYPSGTKLFEQVGTFGSVHINKVNGDLYIATRSLQRLSVTGLHSPTPIASWHVPDAQNFFVAVDNSGSASEGRVYAATTLTASSPTHR